MEFELFNNLERIEDSKNPVCGRYKIDDCEFIIEPNFYTQLLGMKEHHEDKIDIIINAMLETVKKNKKVIFTADYEFPTCYSKRQTPAIGFPF